MADSYFPRFSSMDRMARTRRLVLAALLVAVLTSASCASNSSVQTTLTGPGAAPAPSAAIRFCDSPIPGCPSLAAVSAKSHHSLYVLLTWSNVLAGTHAQTLRFLLPSGEEYQAIETSFAVSSEPSGSASTVVLLPVAGTFIGRGALTGTWQAEVSLDGAVVATPTFRVDR